MIWPWSALGLPGPSELPEIRRAYAQKLKTTHPEEDPEGFQRLHDAYQQACRLARREKRKPIPSMTDEPARASRRSKPETPSGKKEASKEDPDSETEDWDYDALLKGTKEPKATKKQLEEDADSKTEDWDYNELLKGAKEPKTTKKQPEEDADSKTEDWDYSELLKGAKEPKAAKEQPEEDPDSETEDWDYNELLKGAKESKTAREQPKEESDGEAEDLDDEDFTQQEATSEEDEGPARDWDYERLFAEGEEEARAAQRRKIEELREKNRARIAAQEKEQRRRAEDDEEAWAAVMAATHALTLLLSTGAPVAQWRAFLCSQVFWNVKSNLDFIFALEDFLEQNPDLPAAVRKAIYTAYGFERGVAPECRRLSRLLRLDRKERMRLHWANSKFRKEWRSWPMRRRFVSLFGVIFLGLMILLALWSLLEDGIFEDKTPWQEAMCERLEKIYGKPFVHPYKDGEYIFAPEDDPDLLFFAYEDGDRCQTNYPERMVMEQVRKFAEKWDLPLDYDSAGEGYQGQLGETPGAYILQFPLTGKGAAISQLGELLESFKGLRWYWPRVPDFEIFLSYGNLHFYKFRSTEETFDADYAQVVYETKFGPELCRYIADASGMTDGDVLIERGTVSVDGESLFWCAGMSKPPDSVPLRHYLLSADGRQLFILPDAVMEGGGFTLDELRERGLSDTRSIPELGDHASVEVIYTLR